MSGSETPAKDPGRFGARILPFEDSYPQISDSSFLAPSAAVIGEVSLGEEVGIWYNTVIRGDVVPIRIGARTNIQDGCMIHGPHGDEETVIGEEVTVGHHVVIHGCTVEDRSLIGIGAVVLDYARVETQAMIAAGAVVTPRTVVKSGYLYGGIPAKPLRKLNEDELAYFAESARNYVTYAAKAAASLEAHLRGKS